MSQAADTSQRASDNQPEYPRNWEADVVLSDGRTVHIRPIVADDADQVVAFHSRLSQRTRYFRYFGAYPRIPQRDLKRFTQVDYVDRVGLVALLGDEIVAIGRYDKINGDFHVAGKDAPEVANRSETSQSTSTTAGDTADGGMAEVAFVVEDRHQGRGLGSMLLEHLAAAARERGLGRFVAEVLAENSQMIRVFQEAGYQVQREMAEGLVRLEFDLDPTERSLQVARAREQVTEARSVHNLLHPRSVAVIGASADHAKIGHAVLMNLLTADFGGPVYPVHPEHRSVRGVRAYPSVVDIPDEVDLAVVAIPAQGVDEVLDACLEKGVQALVIVSSGFSEAGPEGREAERRLVRSARSHGMRVVGPNALGVVNTDPQVRLNATLAAGVPGRGNTGFFCQSGALGVAILDAATKRGLGLSTFVSAGNRVDVSGNDLLQYWQTDPATSVILLYLESFGNPRKFARLARRLARTKPIVAVKSGRNAVRPALEATSSHIDDTSVQALFEQAGVIRVDSVAELFDTALLLAHQPLPEGSRIAIVGNSTALSMLAVDSALTQGLQVPHEPVDVGPLAEPAEFAEAVRSAAAYEDVDALVVVFAPPVPVSGTDYARALKHSREQNWSKPVVTTFLGVEGVPAELSVPGEDGTASWGSLPSYPAPERAVTALARVVRYAQWRARPAGELVRPPGLWPERARDLVEAWSSRDSAEVPSAENGRGVADLARGNDTVLSAEQAAELLACYGIALKNSSAQAEEVACVIGLLDDPSFGSIVSFGLGGVASELLGDRAYRAVPLSDVDAEKLVRSPRMAPLLTGYQGGPQVDMGGLADLALRLSALAEDVPQVRELVLEPHASASGVRVQGGWIRLGEPPSWTDTGPRRLR